MEAASGSDQPPAAGRRGKSGGFPRRTIAAGLSYDKLSRAGAHTSPSASPTVPTRLSPMPPHSRERCTWQLQWLWGAFKLEQAAGAPLIYDLPPGPVLPVKAPEDEAGSRPEPERERTGACVLAPGDGPQPPGLIASRLAAAEDAVLEAGYRRALVLDPRPLSW